MDEIETVLTCPLGSVCKEIKDNKIHRCMWLIDIRGENPQTGEEENKEDCAIAFTPLAMLENARWSKGTQSAVESERNEVSELNKVFRAIINVKNKKMQDDIKISYLENNGE